MGTPGYVTETVSCNGAIPWNGKPIIIANLPRNLAHDFQVVPTLPRTDWLKITETYTEVNDDGTLDIQLTIDDAANSGTQTCNIRHIAWTKGISAAKAKQQLKKVEVRYPKNHRR